MRYIRRKNGGIMLENNNNTRLQHKHLTSGYQLAAKQLHPATTQNRYISHHNIIFSSFLLFFFLLL